MVCQGSHNYNLQIYIVARSLLISSHVRCVGGKGGEKRRSESGLEVYIVFTPKMCLTTTRWSIIISIRTSVRYQPAGRRTDNI